MDQTQAWRASRPAAGRHQEAATGRRRSTTQGPAQRTEGRPSALQADPPGRRLGDLGNFAQVRRVRDGGCSRPLPPALADRARLQTTEEPDWSEGAAGYRRAVCKTSHPRSSADYSIARASRGRTRGLSPLGERRLTKPGSWRLLGQLVASLLQAIIPQPTINCLRRSVSALRRHMREPPRKKRHYQA